MQPFVQYSQISWITDTIEKGIQECHPIWAGRMIDGYFQRSISTLWYRFMCIDKECREFGQPYYANEKNQQDKWFLENSLVQLN